MKTQIRFEYRKLWNKVSIVALIALIIVTTLYSLVYSQIQRRSMDKNGNFVSGLAAYRAMKEATKDIEGEMDDAYLKKLIKKYNASKEKNIWKRQIRVILLKAVIQNMITAIIQLIMPIMVLIWLPD